MAMKELASKQVDTETKVNHKLQTKKLHKHNNETYIKYSRIW